MSSPASELRNRVTGEVVDAAVASMSEWKPETETSNVEFVANEDTHQQTETESDSEEQTETELDSEEQTELDSEEQTETGEEPSDTEGNEGDNEGQTEEEDEQENDDEQQEEEGSDDEESDTKRYVILEDGKPVVIVINNLPRQQPPFPISITIMFIIVFTLIFLDNVCNLCSLMTNDTCILRMP